MWFHLSDTAWPVEAITELRRPVYGSGEPDEPRFSLSPTVGRAFLGCPHAQEGRAMFVYQVHVRDPELATGIADGEISHEHLIDEQVLSRHGSRIPVSLVGQVLVPTGERVFLQRAIRHWGLNMSHDEERQILWDVEDGVWRFRRPSHQKAKDDLARLRDRAQQ